MHPTPPPSITPPVALTIVSPDADHHDQRVVPYQHILALAQVVKEEQLAAGPPYYAGRDSLNSTPDMYEHPNGDPYITSVSSYQILNTPSTPLSSFSSLPHNAYDATRVPSLSPSPIEEHVPEGMGVPYVHTPSAVPHSAPHDQFQFTNPFLSATPASGGIIRYGTLDRYAPTPDRRMSEPTISSYTSATVATALSFQSANSRLAPPDVRVKSLTTDSPTPSSPHDPHARWTPPVPLKSESDALYHDTMYGASGGFSAGPETYRVVAHSGAEAEPVSPLPSNLAYSASGSDAAQHIVRPEAQLQALSQGGAYSSSSQPTPVALHPSEAASAPISTPIMDPAFSPSMSGDLTHEDPSSPDHSSSKTYSFVPLPGNAIKKRPRRRYDEIERLYRCNFLLPSGEECSKAYGTLNHLNAHIQMQRHGEKRSPTEFKDLRKQWRKAKKDSELLAASQPHERSGMPSAGSPSAVTRIIRPHLGLRIPSEFGPEVVQSPTHMLSPSPIGPSSFGYPTPGGGAGYMHEGHAAPRGAGVAYPPISTPASGNYSLSAVPTLTPHDPRAVSMTHDERAGYDWTSPTPTQSGSRYRYSTDRRFSLPGRPPLSNRSSWASDYNDFEGSNATHNPPAPPHPVTHSPLPSHYMPATSFDYSNETGYQGTGYAQHPLLHSQEMQPTQEELERFPPTNTLLTPLPGYVAPPLDMGHPNLPSPSYRSTTSGATTLLAPIPALSHGGWRRDDAETRDSHYHSSRQL